MILLPQIVQSFNDFYNFLADLTSSIFNSQINTDFYGFLRKSAQSQPAYGRSGRYTFQVLIQIFINPISNPITLVTSQFPTNLTLLPYFRTD